MGNLDVGCKIVLSCVHAPFEPGERDGAVAEAAERFRRDIALLLPERIEHADERRALSRKIAQPEKLEASHALGSERRLNVLLIAENLQHARRFEKFAGLT